MRQRLTYANVTATLALFLALGGGAYAVTGGPAARGRAYRACVATSSGAMRLVAGRRRCGRRERLIVWNQAGPRGVAGLRGPEGGSGPPGAPGTDGAPGAPGAAGATSVTVRTGFSGVANCLPGERAVGGGATAGTGGQLVYSRPNPTSGMPTGWRATDNSADVFSPTTYVVCAAP